ncbi:MAG: glycoside hydrolase family 2 [Verrucomicrobiales bacterium]|nr:glycoside hydrolase family 2 [Verrucomicrobiales bacterium]
MKKTIATLALSVTIINTNPAAADADWRPAGDKIKTPWAEQVNPAAPLTEYPRPQLARPLWVNLNGLWNYAITEKDAPSPSAFDGKILVPFAVESSLSGVQKPLLPTQALWYRREFTAQKPADGQRVLLNFGAVDWRAEVSVNGKPVGAHEGGFEPFTLDITDALNDSGENTLTVKVLDASDHSDQPRGKQQLKPEGIWYVTVSGIWQTVWLETVPAQFISGLKITPDFDRGSVTVSVNSTAADVTVSVRDGGKEIASVSGKANEPLTVTIPAPKAWSPDSPHLYQLLIVSGADKVESYFGLRKISVQKDESGVPRLALNNKILFQYGPLDQGWWPDGLYTAPTDEALRWDIAETKRMGFNMLRKHIKVEPARWYYWADTLGILVWQDMPSAINNELPDGQRLQADKSYRPEAKAIFRRELQAMIDTLYNTACVVVWVPYNEGWGQPGERETNETLAWVKRYDPSRLVNGPSGWTDYGVGDMKDMHKYPAPGMYGVMPERVSVLGEFGGLGLPVEGHVWEEKNWGYQKFKTSGELQQRYAGLMMNLRPLIVRGLAAAVYTQTTDVEVEINGIYTYDRKVAKMPAEWLAERHRPLYAPLPRLTVSVLMPDSRKEPRTWRYTLARPAGDWFAPDFADSDWQSGAAGFGRGAPPNSVTRTEWKGGDIWLRRNFEVRDPDAKSLTLTLYHDDDAEVYLNGVKVLELKNYSTDYELHELPVSALRAGVNVLAIHCRQNKGGQYVDAGLEAGY